MVTEDRHKVKMSWCWCGRYGCCVCLWVVVLSLMVSQVEGESYGNIVPYEKDKRPSIVMVQETSASETSMTLLQDTDTHTCITFTGTSSSPPIIDVRLGSRQTVRTVVVYSKLQGPELEMEVGTVKFRLITKLATTDNAVYVFEGDTASHYIRIRPSGQQETQFSVCFVRAHNVTLSDYCTCEDPCSRNTDWLCNKTRVCEDTNRNNCHRENVALNKLASMSSVYEETGNASQAVNGNTGTTFSGLRYTKDRTLWNCVHTDPDKKNPHWEVDLGHRYNLSYITVYRRSSEPGRDRMEDVTISVDGEVCETLSAASFLNTESVNITCQKAGQLVKVSRTGDGTYGPSLNLCEVQVWTCKPGYYGDGCAEQCSSHCMGGDTKCDSQGVCTMGCQPGWYGQTCKDKCGKCVDTSCARDDGRCSGCENGYYGNTCQDQCTRNCRWCAQQDGECSQCQDGWYPLPHCNTPCSPHCLLGTCDQTSGRCSPCKTNWGGEKCDECVDGRYSPERDCSSRCGQCADQAPCDKKYGSCPNGQCAPGYGSPPYCNQPCRAGKYGAGCQSDCGAGCKDTCDSETGQCTCKPGWKPDKCDQRCSDGRYGQDCGSRCGDGCYDVCNKETGECRCRSGWLPDKCDRRCQRGYYGEACTTLCGEGCERRECDDQTGHCHCQTGWTHTDPKCQTKCEKGKYGVNCSQTCGNCESGTESCQHDTGYCPERRCAEGYAGPTCHDELPDKPGAGTLAALVIGLLVIIVAIILVLLYIRKYHRPRCLDKNRAPPSRHAVRAEAENLYVNCPEPPVYFESYNNGRDQRGATRERVDETGQSNPTYMVPLDVKLNAGRQAWATGTGNATNDDDDGDDEDESEEGRCVQEAVDEERYASYQSLHLAFDRHQKHLLDRLTSGQLLDEFKRLPGGLVYPHQAADLPDNKEKNRFKKILPYDRSRVMLATEHNDPSSDYINASFIRDQRDRNAYIATQGPLQTTVGDFWRMVWQEHVTQIVMLTNLAEKNKSKCHKYWPDKGRRDTHGGVTVTGVDVQLRADFLTRTFTLKAESGASRTVTQYHMVTWPDHGVPTTFALVNLWRYVKNRAQPDSGPLLVHCSAGVGRTGTYIALDIVMDMLLQQTRQKPVNICNVVKKMREDRVIMIQTADQYVFLHEVLLEAYTSRDSRLTLDRMDACFPHGVSLTKPDPRTDSEYKSLSQMKNFLSKPKYTLAEQEENRDKNRDPDVLPDDSHLLYLSVHVHGRNQYINAVSMPSFRQQRGMLLTQLPMSHTLVDMWRLVEGFDVVTIVSISSRGEEDKMDYCQYWPRDPATPIKTGPFCISLASSESLGQALTSYILAVENHKSGKSREVRVLHYTAWGQEVPEVTSDVMRALELLDTSHQPDRAFIVQCWDGARKSGLFCALYNVITRVTYDREVDVYLTARHVHSIRPQAFTSKEQYRYCYYLVGEYKKAFDVYANT